MGSAEPDKWRLYTLRVCIWHAKFLDNRFTRRENRACRAISERVASNYLLFVTTGSNAQLLNPGSTRPHLPDECHLPFKGRRNHPEILQYV